MSWSKLLYQVAGALFGFAGTLIAIGQWLPAAGFFCAACFVSGMGDGAQRGAA